MSEIKAIEEQNIKLSLLHIRYIPVVIPVNIWGRDMRLIASPHFDLMRLFKKHGCDVERIKRTRYYQERARRYEIGIKKWTPDKLRSHIKKRYATFKSLAKFGINKRLLVKDPVCVLETPFWQTRFNNVPEWVRGYEIWNGAGRCAAAYALGLKRFPVTIVQDKYPGTGKKGKFKDKLKNVKGVWHD